MGALGWALALGCGAALGPGAGIAFAFALPWGWARALAFAFALAEAWGCGVCRGGSSTEEEGVSMLFIIFICIGFFFSKRLGNLGFLYAEDINFLFTHYSEKLFSFSLFV